MKRALAISACILLLLGLPFGYTFVHQAIGSELPYAGGYTVEVLVNDGTGSGFYIGEGYIVTANHVVTGVDGSDIASGKIATDMGAFRSFTVMWRSKELDIALLLVDEPINLTVIHMDCSPPEYETVTMHGLPRGEDFMQVTASIGTRIYRDIKAAGSDVVWKVLVSVSVEAQPGMSGGPIVDRDGNVVAVTVGGGGGTSVAVPAEEVCKLLP